MSQVYLDLTNKQTNTIFFFLDNGYNADAITDAINDTMSALAPPPK